MLVIVKMSYIVKFIRAWWYLLKMKKYIYDFLLIFFWNWILETKTYEEKILHFFIILTEPK
jgi:hypothetical protein